MAVVTACAGDGAVLADLPGLRLSLQAFELVDRNADLRRPTRVAVYLDYDVAMFRALTDGECACISYGMGGAFAGAPLQVTARGSINAEDPATCLVPILEAELPLDTRGETILVIDDGEQRARAQFAADAITARIATHPTWELARGRQAVFGWSHPEDLAEPIEVVFRTADADHAVAHTIVDGQLVVTPTIAGDGTLWIRLEPERGRATSCSGAHACTYVASRSYAHAVRVR